MTNRYTSLVGVFAKSIMLVHSVQRDLLDSHSVVCKVAEVVPTHSVDVCSSDFISKLGMMFSQKIIEILVSNECSLLNDLRVDAW